MPPRLLWTCVCVVLGAACLLSRRWALRDTTLIAPYRWALFSLGSVGLVELLLVHWDVDPATVEATRYAAATTTCCPLVAILGAKRPQNIGWQLIVASLWIVLVLPVGETLILWRGGRLDIGPARQWLIMILLLVGVSNYVTTRFGIAAILATLGQASLLASHLPVMPPAWLGEPLVGLGLITGALCVAWLGRGDRRHGNWDCVWADFRDAFGTVWALRVIERINTTATLCDWDQQLGWFGFAPRPQSRANPDQLEEVERSMRTALRRFVSQEWIDRRVK